MSTYQKEHMEMEYARHFLRALKLLEEAQRGNEDPDTLINGLLQAATEFTMQTVIYYRSGLGGRHWPEYL